MSRARALAVIVERQVNGTPVPRYLIIDGQERGVAFAVANDPRAHLRYGCEVLVEYVPDDQYAREVPRPNIDRDTYRRILSTAQGLVDTDRLYCRDEGTCVLGAGIVDGSDEVLIRAPFQGNTGSFKACARALAYLREHGIPARWYDGIMD